VPGQRLTSSECQELEELAFTIDRARVRVYRESESGISAALRRVVLWLSRDRAVALGNHVFLPSHCQHELPVLAHELTHCAQYQTWGPWRYFSRGVVNQVRDLLHRKLGIGSSPYRYIVEPGKPFSAYGMEQQGQMVEDYFRDRLTSSRPPDPWSDEHVPEEACPPKAPARSRPDPPPSP
jgi:hypothetical protein